MTVIDAALEASQPHAFPAELAPRQSLQANPWLWPADQSAEQCWAAWAKSVANWLQSQSINPRDALVIVPVGAVLSHARQAWAEAVGGWAPTIETVATLVTANQWRMETSGRLGWVSMDAVADQLTVTHQLGQETWCKQWRSRDPRGFDHAMAEVVQAAQLWIKRAQAVPPAQRSAYWQHARQAMAKAVGQTHQYGSREKLLLSWALEWAIESMSNGWGSDALFDLPYQAWVGVSAGDSIAPGTEAHLMLGLMAQAQSQGRAVYWSSARADQGAHPATVQPALLTCQDAEDEARQATALVLQHVKASRQNDGLPVALIALDRSLIRRVRAMLEGAGACLADETGWRLSTTRAAAAVTRLLQVGLAQATTDDLLDWLKSGWIQWPQLEACDELDQWCRQMGWLRAWDAPTLNKAGKPCPDAAVALWQQAHTSTQALRQAMAGKRLPLRQWLSITRQVLVDTGAWHMLEQDPAGLLMLESLHLGELETSDTAAAASWSALLDQTLLHGAGFRRWVHDVLEGTTFRPTAPEGRIDVVVTPLARSVMRPFAAVVMPGCDARQLGGTSVNANWLGPGLTAEMGLATPENQRDTQWEAFELLLSRPQVICLHRSVQGSEPVEPSPWLDRWAQAHPIPWQAAQPEWGSLTLQRTPVVKPAPTLSAPTLGLLPKALSATSYEALRQCPYRFFAQSILKLKDLGELEEGLDRADYGIWLHEVIRRFHEQREQQLALSTLEEDIENWLTHAQQVMRDLGLDSDVMRPYFLPYISVLGFMARAYVTWLYEHEAEGWRCVDNESNRQRVYPLDTQRSLNLHGQLDRIDTQYRDGKARRMVIDYKTGSLGGLKERVKQPLEDTQLPFYALLEHDVTDAAYLHLDAKAATLIQHDEVDQDADTLLEGIRQDMIRIAEGAPLQALGEGAACGYCQVRGLCRKDHWPIVSANDNTPTTPDAKEEGAA